jgi:hypothetical protein
MGVNVQINSSSSIKPFMIAEMYVGYTVLTAEMYVGYTTLTAEICWIYGLDC